MQALNWKIPVKALAGSVNNVIGFILILPIKIYRLCISPILGSNCRFYPSCSAYAITAIEQHGAIKGSLLAGKRLCRCHPYSDGGIDFVPESPEAQAYNQEKLKEKRLKEKRVEND